VGVPTEFGVAKFRQIPKCVSWCKTGMESSCYNPPPPPQLLAFAQLRHERTDNNLQASSSKAGAEKSFQVLQRITELSKPDTEHSKYHGAWLELKVACLAPYFVRCAYKKDIRC